MFFTLVTEDEITHGIFNVSSPEGSCLCYARTLTNLHNCLSDDKASGYIDVLPTLSPASIDVVAQKLLHNLKHHKLPQAVSNHHSYSIPWVPGGVSKQVSEHGKYLSQLCEQVLVDTKHLIDKAVRARGDPKSTLHAEVLHHSTLCLSKCESYCDRRDGVLMRIKQYIQNPVSHPLIVHGKSGSGKTSVMAKAAKSMREWSKEKLVVLRFLGTSLQSTHIREVLLSICDQICSLCALSTPAFNKMDTIDIVQYFRNDLLLSLERCGNENIVIMLDSIDQLSPMDGAHSMKWLPLLLPSNVHIVVSMLNEKYECLENIKSLLLYSKESYVELGPMPVEAGLEILDLWLSKIGRTITVKQKAMISKAFLACPQPLFLKLIFGLARSWKSYTDCDSITLANSIQGALYQFYENLEIQFGKLLVQRALGYLTAAKNGLTEVELEDVLSLDNEVLNDVYQYWDPPVKGLIRIPSQLWKRIRQFVSDYIVEQQADGLTVLVWYHRQFNESATSRYVQDGTVKPVLHFMLAELFEGTWGGAKSKSVKLTHRGIHLKDANRQLPSQPLKFSECVYNFRKLSELPYHLLYSCQIDKLKDLVLCNYNWIHTKLTATNFPAVVQDYITTSETIENDTDVSLVCETLSLSSNNLKNSPNFLAGQLLGRLLALNSSSWIHQLLEDAKKWIDNSEHCIFQPLNNCLISPGGELKATITGHPQVVLGVITSASLPLLISHSKGSGCDLFQVWDLTSLECIENTSTLKLHGTTFLQAFNYVLTQEYLVAVTTQSYALWNIRTGECIDYTDQLDSSVEVTCLAATNDCKSVLLGTTTGHVLYSNNFSSPKICSDLKFDGTVKSMHVTPNNDAIVVLSGEDCISVIDSRTQSILNSTAYVHSTFTAFAVAISSDFQQYFITGTKNGSVCFSELSNLTFTTTTKHSKAVKSVCQISSLDLAVSGSLDKIICIWDLKKQSFLRCLSGHMDGVWCLSSIPNTTRVVSGSKDDYLKVWDVLSGECLHTLEGHSSWISCVTAINSDIIVSGSNDKNLKFWRLSSDSKTYDPSSRHSAQPECIVLSDSKLAASGGPDAVKVWDPSDGRCLHSIPTSTSCLLFTSDAKFLVTGSKKGMLEVYDSKNLSKIKVLSEHTEKITGLLSIRDMVISASLDSMVIIWQNNCSEKAILMGHTSGVTCIASSQDEMVIASGSQTGAIFLWEIALMGCVGNLEGHIRAVNCLGYTADNKVLISGSDDKTARVWNTTDMSCTNVINYSDSVKALCVIDDMVIAGAHCSKQQLKSWNIETGECVNDFIGHTHAVMCMLKIDEHYILTGSRDGTVRIWNYRNAKMVSSFDLQSQVKHISVSKTATGDFILASTTKSGPIAFLKFSLTFSL